MLFQRRNAVQIHNVGYNFCHDSTFRIIRPSGSGDYLLLIIKSPAVFDLHGTDTAVSPNSLIVYQKDTPQYYRAANDIFSNDWIHFDITADERSEIGALGIPFDTVIPCGDTTQLSQLIKSMYSEGYSANPYKEESLRLYMKLLLLKIGERIKVSHLSDSHPYYDKFSALRLRIYSSPEKSHSVSELAEQLRLSESYFQHLYKRIFGVSVISDVITARIDHGKYLLSGTDYPIGVIAGMCGYKNDVHFMRQFKAASGLTPSEYRRRFKLSANELNGSKQQQPYTL